MTTNDVLDALVAVGPTAAHKHAVEGELLRRHRGVITDAQARKAIEDAISSGALSIDSIGFLRCAPKP